MKNVMDEKGKAGSGLAGWKKATITLVILLVAGAFIFSQLPQDIFPTDLSRIGQGVPALVVARDISFAAGAEVMALISDIRSDYSDRVQFLAVHLGHPDGQSFAHQYGMRDGTVVLFSGEGSPLATLTAPQSTDEIRQLLTYVE
jgi:hypothetical protein